MTNASSRSLLPLPPTEAPREFSVVDWNPNGQSIYLSATLIPRSPHDHGDAFIWSVSSAELTSLLGIHIDTVSPDGAYILSHTWAEGQRGENSGQWGAMTSDGSRGYAGGDGTAAWLPDSRLVASFCLWHGFNSASSQIAIIAPDGQRQEIASYPKTCAEVYPSHDGTIIAITHSGLIDIVDRDGTFIAQFRGGIPAWTTLKRTDWWRP
ncbi:MAG: hypothetical protein HGA19_13735 [Oscillochloris sp.]|nr:hypothetical protein [Oscillochloris sp.]